MLYKISRELDWGSATYTETSLNSQAGEVWLIRSSPRWLQRLRVSLRPAKCFAHALSESRSPALAP